MSAFDGMCGMAERIGNSEISQAIRSSHVFIIPEDDRGGMAKLEAHCPYPFPRFVLPRDNSSVLVYRDSKTTSTVFDSCGNMFAYQRGNGFANAVLFRFITTTAVHSKGQHDNAPDPSAPIVYSMCDGDNCWAAKARVERAWSDLDGDLQEVDYIGANQANIDSLCRDSLQSAFWAIFSICEPSRFIVRMIPDKVWPSNSPKIPRQHQRPIYTLLNKEEIKTRFLVSQPRIGEHADPSPHWRRAHLRRLSSEKFVNKVGQVVPVKSCWVGPDEFQQGRKTYKVLYDL